MILVAMVVVVVAVMEVEDMVREVSNSSLNSCLSSHGYEH